MVLKMIPRSGLARCRTAPRVQSLQVMMKSQISITIGTSTRSDEKPVDAKVITPKAKEPILALKKTEEQGLQKEDADAGASFEVLALMHKSNARFSLRQIKEYVDEKINESDKDADSEKKHVVPQHRRFLTFPKVGPGTPSKREKVNNGLKLDRAAAMAHKYQLAKLGYVDQDAGDNMLTAHKGLVSPIEDKIQLSILQGDFDNLEGSGKPLNDYQNPFVDRTTDMAYELLRKNGVKPEWIELQQCMGSLRTDLKARLRAAWATHCLHHNHAHMRMRAAFGETIMHESNEIAVQGCNEGTESFRMPSRKDDYIALMVKAHEEDERVCNMKIDAYNLQVPSHILTRGRISLEFEVNQACEEKYASVKEAEAARDESNRIVTSLQHVRNAARADAQRRGSRTKFIADNTTRPSYDDYVNGSAVSSSSLSPSSSHRRTNAEGELVFRVLMAPIDSLAGVLQKWMQTF